MSFLLHFLCYELFLKFQQQFLIHTVWFMLIDMFVKFYGGNCMIDLSFIYLDWASNICAEFVCCFPFRLCGHKSQLRGDCYIFPLCSCFGEIHLFCYGDLLLSASLFWWLLTSRSSVEIVIFINCVHALSRSISSVIVICIFLLLSFGGCSVFAIPLDFFNSIIVFKTVYIPNQFVQILKLFYKFQNIRVGFENVAAWMIE
ncbi:unnamed protein product [Vicia faba]|uniref:Uncharacterized protein n=1 Tax=Vicia faba TaxID=3906 RepID=A0AAV0ZHG8_VICFA|nr:unnamed protein product [Vicia faba]